MTEPLGELERHGDTAVVRFTRRLAHPIDKVWRALTEPEHQRAWFPARIDGALAAGAPLTFTFAGDEGAPTTGELLAVDPPHLLELTWEGDVLRFELVAAGSDTVLTMTATMPGFGRAARDATGWHVCLEALAADLAGGTPIDNERWRAVNPWYVERFGPEAATIGPPGA